MARAIGVGSTINSATLSCHATDEGGAAVYQARLYDWGGGVPTTAKFRTDVQFATLPLLSHLASGSWSLNTYAAFADDAFAANIVLGGYTRIVMGSELFATGGAPDVLIYKFIHSVGNSNPPKLVIDYTPPPYYGMPSRAVRATYLRR